MSDMKGLGSWKDKDHQFMPDQEVCVSEMRGTGCLVKLFFTTLALVAIGCLAFWGYGKIPKEGPIVRAVDGWMNQLDARVFGDITREPILSIETGMHTRALTRIGADRDGKVLVTASYDDTIRIWDLGSRRLLRVLRIPTDGIRDYSLHAVDISPNGQVVAASGLTCIDWGNTLSVYLFDAETGSMIRRLTGHPQVVLHLSFSKDGKYLAATDADNCLWIYDTNTWSLKSKNKQSGMCQ